MKNPDFFEKLNRELDAILPEMSDAVNNAPIAVKEPNAPNDGKTEPKRRTKGFWHRHWKAAASIAASVVVLCVGILGVVFSLPASDQTFSVMKIDINPSVELVLDGDFRVVKPIAVNADGDMLLSDKTFSESLSGKHGSEAALLLSQRAAQTGYFDLSNFGTPENYNEIKITVVGNSAMSESSAAALQTEIRDYFCAKGVYLYIDVQSEQHDLSDKKEEYDNLTTLFRDRLQDVGELIAYAKNTAYSYAEELLKDALYKYDLLCEIDALDQSISNHDANPFASGYWTIGNVQNEELAALCSETEALLEKLYLLYGLDYRARNLGSQIGFNAAYTACAGSYSESLRELAQTGLSDETFGGLEHLTIQTEYLKFVAAGELVDIINELFGSGGNAGADFSDKIAALIEKRIDTLTKRFSAALELPRVPIEENDYADFLTRIGK